MNESHYTFELLSAMSSIYEPQVVMLYDTNSLKKTNIIDPLSMNELISTLFIHIFTQFARDSYDETT